MRKGMGLLLLLLLVSGLLQRGLAAVPSPAGQKYAVLVGVSKYQHYPQSQWLDGCDLDAQSLADFLASPRGGTFPSQNVKLLLNEGATTRNVRLAFDYVIKNARPGDVVYLFFACHGKVDRYGAGEVGYLMLYDSEPQFLNATALPMDEVRRYVDINLRQAAQVVLITDACHAGGVGPGENDSKLRRSSVADHLLEIGERNGALNIMACRRDESAVEDPRLGGHGVLTYALLKALSGDGNSAPDGTVRAQDVLEYITRQVPRLTGQQQHPRHSSNYNDDFAMARLKLAGPALHLPDAVAKTLDSSPGQALGASVFGASLRVVGAPVHSELYLVQGQDQRTIGRVLSQSNVLVLENLRPGSYRLVQSHGGEQKEWPIQLSPGLQSFDVRAGALQ
jgi:hypothetical protein